MNKNHQNEDSKKKDELFFTDSDDQMAVILPDDTGNYGWEFSVDGKTGHEQEEEEEEDIE